MKATRVLPKDPFMIHVELTEKEAFDIGRMLYIHNQHLPDDAKLPPYVMEFVNHIKMALPDGFK